MKKIFFALLATVVVAMSAQAQPIHRFSVKIGIDRTSVDSLGGQERVVHLIKDMFRQVNKAFNYDSRFAAIHHFEVDWDAFYIYDGLSTDEISKPHPDHDYLVVMDGYKSNPKETGGGWYGDTTHALTTTVSTHPSSSRPSTVSSTSSVTHAVSPISML